MGPLFERSVATLVRSWAYLASGSPGAALIETDDVAIAAFVHSPDRQVLSNALVLGGLESLEGSLELVERTYAERGVAAYAVWVHERAAAAARAVEARGYAFDTSTRAMAMDLADLARVEAPALDLAEVSLAEFWALLGVQGLAPELSPDGAHIYAARFEGEPAATLMSFDHDGDCGIYMVGTVPGARRQGLATALSAHALAQARERGCRTASLQATPMAERVYSKVGFRDLGRFLEFVPGA